MAPGKKGNIEDKNGKVPLRRKWLLSTPLSYNIEDIIKRHLFGQFHNIEDTKALIEFPIHTIAPFPSHYHKIKSPAILVHFLLCSYASCDAHARPGKLASLPPRSSFPRPAPHNRRPTDTRSPPPRPRSSSSRPSPASLPPSNGSAGPAPVSGGLARRPCRPSLVRPAPASRWLRPATFAAPPRPRPPGRTGLASWRVRASIGRRSARASSP